MDFACTTADTQLVAQTTAASTAFASFAALPGDLLNIAIAGWGNLTTSDDTEYGLPGPTRTPYLPASPSTQIPEYLASLSVPTPAPL